MYGLGGLVPALIKVAKLFEKETESKVNIKFGPQGKWEQEAKKC